MAAGICLLFKRIYLSVYNWAVFFGWTQVLFFAVKTQLESGHEHVYNAVEKPLQLAQTAAVLEKFLSPTCFGGGNLLFRIGEITGFSYTSTDRFEVVPHLGHPTSLRYSTFMLLYPTGISSEVGLIYLALPYIKASEKFCLRMPNQWNFSFDNFYAAILALGIYTPGSPHMYTLYAWPKEEGSIKIQEGVDLQQNILL